MSKAETIAGAGRWQARVEDGVITIRDAAGLIRGKFVGWELLAAAFMSSIQREDQERAWGFKVAEVMRQLATVLQFGPSGIAFKRSEALGSDPSEVLLSLVQNISGHIERLKAEVEDIKIEPKAKEPPKQIWHFRDERFPNLGCKQIDRGWCFTVSLKDVNCPNCREQLGKYLFTPDGKLLTLTNGLPLLRPPGVPGVWPSDKPKEGEEPLRDIEAAKPEPIPMLLHCPACHERHIDAGEFASKPHHTHACQSCGHCWRPAVVPTVGVQFLPGFKDEEEPKPGEHPAGAIHFFQPPVFGNLGKEMLHTCYLAEVTCKTCLNDAGRGFRIPQIGPPLAAPPGQAAPKPANSPNGS